MQTGVADKVVELRRQNPYLKAIEIARQLGVSRERVRTILAKRGLPTRFVIERELCRDCGQPLFAGSKEGLCRQCFARSQTIRVCVRCGQKYQLKYRGGKPKYCPDCRVIAHKKLMRFLIYRRNWQRLMKGRKHRCIYCQSVFDSIGELTRHRVDTGELNDPDFRKWVMAYRATHSYWRTLEYFHISQETFRAIEAGRETNKHH